MQIRVIEPEQLPKVRKRLMTFTRLHGDRRITKHGIHWLKKFQADALSKEQGTMVIAAMENNTLTGLLTISDFGRDESYVVVHRRHRKSGLAKKLIQEMLRQVDKAYGRVALDNTASIKMCLAMGMVGFKLVNGPTGKPTMWFGTGNWKYEDV